MRILVQRHNCVIFLRKLQVEAVRVNGDRYWAMLNEFLFTIIEEEDFDNVWLHYTTALRATQPKLHQMFQALFLNIALSAADLMSFGRNCDLTPLDYYLWRAVKDKCYVDKPETIDVLKDNIREVISEIQLHTIDSVLKNWTNHVGYCMASRGGHLNIIISTINRKVYTFK